MRVRGWFRLFAMLAVFGLIVASCSSDDDDEGGSGGGGGTDSEEAATCEGTPGEADTIPPPSGATADGAGQQVGMVLDVGSRNDKSFNQAAALGLDTAAEDFGVEVQLLEPAEDGSNRGDLMRSLAEDGVPYIIGVGFAFAESMQPLAAEFPDIKFAIIDDASFEAPNVTSLVFSEEEGSYLVGMAAALKSKTGKLGFIGGVETDLIKKFEGGFKAGAESVNEDIEIDVKYITQIPDFSGFRDPAKAKTIAEGMYSNGADVVYHAAGLSGTGLFPVAAAEDRLAIGVDSNQYQQVPAAQQECMLTSMIKRVDLAVYESIADFLNGELEAGEVRFDLESDGIGYATDGGQLADITDQLDEAKDQIVSGEIEVPAAP